MRPQFDAVYAAARRITVSASDAEDLVQEVSLKAFLKLDELERMEYPRAWLLRVLYNEFIDGERARQRSPVSLAESSGSTDETVLPAEACLQPDEQADRMIRIDIVLRAMEMLNKEHCSMLALHDIDGFSLEELHSMTGIPIGTIKSQLHRTRVKLGTRLVRTWKGQAHPVRVVERGFEYKGKRYASLSEIARLITGTRWSGPAFFGLKAAKTEAEAS